MVSVYDLTRLGRLAAYLNGHRLWYRYIVLAAAWRMSRLDVWRNYWCCTGYDHFGHPACGCQGIDTATYVSETYGMERG